MKPTDSAKIGGVEAGDLRLEPIESLNLLALVTTHLGYLEASDRLDPRIPVLMNVQHKLAELIRGEDGP